MCSLFARKYLTVHSPSTSLASSQPILRPCSFYFTRSTSPGHPFSIIRPCPPTRSQLLFCCGLGFDSSLKRHGKFFSRQVHYHMATTTTNALGKVAYGTNLNTCKVAIRLSIVGTESDHLFPDMPTNLIPSALSGWLTDVSLRCRESTPTGPRVAD